MCFSYVLVNFDSHSKLDVKSKKCFFIAYCDKSFRFWFRNDQNKKIIKNRNVMFNNKALYKDKISVETYATNTNL